MYFSYRYNEAILRALKDEKSVKIQSSVDAERAGYIRHKLSPGPKAPPGKISPILISDFNRAGAFVAWVSV